MSTESQREALRFKYKPFPELVRLAWPITVSMLSYSVMSLVDTLFAGRLGATALGAVGFGGVVMFTILCFGMGLLRGAKTIVSQEVGAGLRSRVSGSIGAAVYAALAFGALTAVFGQVVALGLPVVADGSAAVRLAQRYVAIRLLGAPFILLAFAIREVRCALGDSRSPMRTALVANALHIPLNFALIFSAGLGVTGAALSSVLAQALEAGLLVFVQRQDGGLGLGNATKRDVVDLWHIGWPLGAERLFNVTSFTLLVALVARSSDVDLAAHQVANQVVLFTILPVMAISEAAAVLAGQAVGAGEDGLVRRVARIAAVAGTAYGAVSAMAYLLFGPVIAGALTHDDAVRRIAVQLLHIGAAWQAFTAIYFVAAAVLRGAGDVRYSTLATSIIAWVVTPPIVFVLGIECHLGAVGGWLALLAEWIVGALVLWWRLEGNRWFFHAERARARLASHSGELLVPEPVTG